MCACKALEVKNKSIAHRLCFYRLYTSSLYAVCGEHKSTHTHAETHSRLFLLLIPRTSWFLFGALPIKLVFSEQQKGHGRQRQYSHDVEKQI